MKALLFTSILSFSFQSFADTVQLKDLQGQWEPNGEFPASGEMVLYELDVLSESEATYTSLGKQRYSLDCKYKPSSTQDSVHVYYCYSKEVHVITLSLSGWELIEGSAQSTRPGKLIYGFEYWLHPSMNGVYGGVPVSLKPKNHITSKGSG